MIMNSTKQRKSKMSLEAKIEELTNAVKALTETMSNGVKVSTEAERVMKSTDVVKDTVKADKKESVESAVTHADLKAACLKVARAGKKTEVKDVLSSYDAVKAADVAEDKISEVIEKLEAL